MLSMLNVLFHILPVVRCHVIIRGRVFDGSYHLLAEKSARQHHVTGVMNVRDAFTSAPYIEMDIEGTEPVLDDYLTDLRKGTRDSSISHISVQMLNNDRKHYGEFRRVS